MSQLLASIALAPQLMLLLPCPHPHVNGYGAESSTTFRTTKGYMFMEQYSCLVFHGTSFNLLLFRDLPLRSADHNGDPSRREYYDKVV